MITPYLAPQSLTHGGGLIDTASQSAIPLAQWIDLSTGINPQGWPVPDIPSAVWQRLPENNDGLEAAATQYYLSKPQPFMVTAGSQAMIQLLPQVIRQGVVWVPQEGYAEHAYWWHRHGHDVFYYQPEDLEALLDASHGLTVLPFDTLLVINPNNPTTHTYSKATLESLSSLVTRYRKRLVIDEAFLDTQPEHSMIEHCTQPHVIVFRSLGKFFGLAGIRCGFIFANAELIAQLAHHSGPWGVTTPSRWVATRALQDTQWQHLARAQLRQDSQRLFSLITRTIPASMTTHQEVCDYFCTVVFTEQTVMKQVVSTCLERGILIRQFEQTPRIRIGLPSHEQQWRTLEQVMDALSAQLK